MNELIANLEDFLGDFNLDVYDEAELPDGRYKLSTVLIKINTNELQLRAIVNRAIRAANAGFKDGITITLNSLKINEKSTDEIDFDMVLTVKEEKNTENKSEVKDSDETRNGYNYMIDRYWNHTEQLYQIAQAIQAADDLDESEKKNLLDKIQQSFDAHLYDSLDVKDKITNADSFKHYILAAKNDADKLRGLKAGVLEARQNKELTKEEAAQLFYFIYAFLERKYGLDGDALEKLSQEVITDKDSMFTTDRNLKWKVLANINYRLKKTGRPVKDGVKMEYVPEHSEEVWGSRRVVDPAGYEVQAVYSDISGDEIEPDEVFFDRETEKLCSAQEAWELFKERYHVRLVEHKDLDPKFVKSIYYDEADRYYTDDLNIARDPARGETYYSEDSFSEDQMRYIDDIIGVEGSTFEKFTDDDIYEYGMEDLRS